LNLRDAFFCIDCDEVFIIQGSRCNPRCPVCASSVFAPLSAWVRTWNAREYAVDRESVVARDETPVRKRKIEIIHPTPIAA